jgi:hypothetical protein
MEGHLCPFRYKSVAGQTSAYYWKPTLFDQFRQLGAWNMTQVLPGQRQHKFPQ